MLTGTQDNEKITERVAALDIGKAELACCVRVPDEDRPGRRLQDTAMSHRSIPPVGRDRRRSDDRSAARWPT